MFVETGFANFEYLGGSHYNFTATSGNFGQLRSLFITENCLFCDTRLPHRQQGFDNKGKGNMNNIVWCS